MFRKILIANRGEIALRIIRTCKKLGIKTVAVYSQPDVESRHVVHADEAYEIGPGEPSESYLSVERIVHTARKAKAEAVHPGYGFLAENPELARVCEEAGLAFIGPRSRVLSRVANKLESKRIVSETGVPVIPGSMKEIRTLEDTEKEARRIGFPVLIKAVYGGGGRGMRIVRAAKELTKAFDMAGVEAEAGFGRPELYIEKYLQAPRHIEVQILAGPRGRVVQLGERECSLQRRYQKILEETPSTVLSDRERKHLFVLALKVARTTGYENAGTVEFVRSKDGRFYYLETNKRIQVEHIITEMVTGIDIVEQQLRMASGEGLALSQEEIPFLGAAINCRINAEDPAHGFAPTPGRVTRFIPANGPGIRVDTALYDGCPVPEYYDSLIAKIASHGRDREEAVLRMKVALGETAVEGVKTTIPVHQMILDDPAFLKGNYHTQLLDRLLKEWKPKPWATSGEIAGIFLAVNRAARSARPVAPLATGGTRHWRLGLQERAPQTRHALYVEGL